MTHHHGPVSCCVMLCQRKLPFSCAAWLQRFCVQGRDQMRSFFGWRPLASREPGAEGFFRDVDSSVLFLFQDFRNSYTVYRYHLFDCIYMSWWIIEIPFSSCTDHTGQWGRRKESTGLRLKWLPATPIGSRIPWLNCEQSCLKGHQPKWNGSSKWRIVKRWTVLAATTGQLILYQSSSEVETK